MGSQSKGSEDIAAPLSAHQGGPGSHHDWSVGTRMAPEPRVGLAAAFKSAVAYFGRTEPASEQCEANR
jgi:hypothetical protein